MGVRKMKNTILVIGAVVVAVCIATMIFSGCIESNTEISGGSLIKMMYFTGMDVPNASDIFWTELDIKKNGEAKFIKFLYHDILEVKYGNLTQEELDSLMAFIETENFYRLNESYDHEKGLICEGDFTTITVNAEDGNKSVFAHCILAPDNFYEIREKLMKIGKDLPNEQFGVFIRSIKLDREKFEGIKETFLKREGIEEVEKGFVYLSTEELKNYPYLNVSISNPEEFTYIGSWNNTEINKFVLEKYDYFFVKVNNKYYQIDVYYANKNESSSSSYVQYTR